MLSRLYIKNFGLIDEINQSFEPGLNTITGETGAGKSMIIGALGLILGERADVKVVRNPAEKCILEAEFIAEESLKVFFEENNLDWSSQLLIRREITANGRSRAFVNDTPVKLDLLKKLNTELIDIHTQEHTLRINTPEYQLYLLDLFAGSDEKRLEFQKLFEAYNALQSELKLFELQMEKDKNEFDFIDFQFKELASADIKAGEISSLEQERELVANREAIQQSIGKAKYLLSENDPNVSDMLHSLSSDFSRLQGISDWLKDYSDRLEKVYREIKDISYELNSRADEIDNDQGRLEEIDDRLSTYYRLENKYKVKGAAALLKLKEAFEEKLGRVENFEEVLKEKKALADASYNKLLEAGKVLHTFRKQAAPGFEKLIENDLKQLGISHPKVYYRFVKKDQPESSGLYLVELMFSSNPDAMPGRVEEVASGGEKSRLMLVMKSILGHRLNIKSIVFDEIDSGISGEVALRTGELLEKLGGDSQVISITHLSQVAGKGQNQYKVSKQVIDGKTNIKITRLNREQRIEEIAEMISGKEVTEAARNTAKQILG